MQRWGSLLALFILGGFALSACADGIYDAGGSETALTDEPERVTETPLPSPIPLDLTEPSPSPSPTAEPSPASPTATPLEPQGQPGPSPTPSLPPATPTLTRPAMTRLPERVAPNVWPTSTGEAPPALVQDAITDLADRLGVDEDEITVLADTAVVWNDGSMGCPKPGEFYIQIPIAGYRIILGYQDRLYDYHTDEDTAFPCENSLSARRPALGVRAPQLELLALAMTDLSQRLGVATQAITPQRLTAQVWSDASLGCPKPGEVYAQVVTEGYVIELRVDDDVYTYHTSLDRAVPCEQ